ncbi:MAG: holo-[acyl-carrier protein] synthase [Micromonosporaceae bacterium]|jgi:holo-[acyl-carrier protein] synthase|nr:holo-[acyl-carrier protein] synthase [Micromonosporaceae bacterium]
MPRADAVTGAPLAVGVDIVDTERLRAMIERYPESALDRLFTARERETLHGARGVRWDSVAGRFAAKEAVRKVFGPCGAVPRWNDIEVVAGRHGEPVLTLLGDASALARRCGFRRMLLSIAHEKRSAVAVVFAL